MHRIVAALLCLLALAPVTRATSLESAAQRIDADVAAGKPLITHLVVALVDNQHQAIVPVPAANSRSSWSALCRLRSRSAITIRRTLE